MTPEAQNLIDDLQALDGPSREVFMRAYRLLNPSAGVSKHSWRFVHLVDSKAYHDAALILIPDGMVMSIIGSGDIPEVWLWWKSGGFGTKSSGEHKSIPHAIIIAAINAGEVERMK